MYSPDAYHACQRASAPRIHRARWLMALGVPLLLFSMLYMSMREWPAVYAAVEVQVGNCVGTGDYTTIQDAVDAAIPDTIINICPGTYPESINLSLMGIPGDITLRRLPGQTDDVLIMSPMDPGIMIYPGSFFFGNITLESLKVTSDDQHGIDFGAEYNYSYVGGNIVISDVTASGNDGAGALLAGSQDVAVINSSFDDNGLYGLVIAASQNVTVHNTTALNNGIVGEPDMDASGISIYDDYMLTCDVGATATSYTINVDSVAAGGNQGWGIEISTAWDTYISNTEVYSNALDGVIANAIGCSDETTITLTNARAEHNGFAQFMPRGEVTTEAFHEFGGFRLIANGLITVDNSEANANSGFGYCPYSLAPATPLVKIQDSSAADNIGEGFFYSILCPAYYFGIDSSASDRGKFGTGADLTINDAGWQPTLIVTNSTATGNGGKGGFVVSDPLSAVTLTNISALENSNGIFVGISDDMFPVGAADSHLPIAVNELSYPQTWIKDSLIQGNTDSGVLYLQDYLLPTAAVAQPNTISGSIICENGIGVHTQQIAMIVGDIHGQALPMVDARGNWWGNVSGPHHPNNPGGTGDAIVETTAPVGPQDIAIDVAFAPWINLIDANITPNPTLVGIPASVEFRFRDNSASYFLGNGVGDPNNGPLFTLSTPNGTLAGGATQQRFIVNGLIQDVAIPVAAGPMVVNLDGPCGLDSAPTLLAATPAIELEKTPKVQSVLEGGSAVFAVTLRNTGNVTLTQISVSDPTTPACGRTASTLGDLGINASTTYTCEVTNIRSNLITAVLAQGFARINGVAAGNPVTDIDLANVMIAAPAIDVTMTPARQGVAVGDSAVFTVTLYNTGNVTLTQISVSDPVAPACGRTAGALGDLSIYASVTYTCELTNVTNNLLNTVTAQGFARIHGTAAGNAVADTASAEVFVVSLTLTKTVFVNGYREHLGKGVFNTSDCALASDITVPVNATVKYCYTLTNTGDYTVTTHSLVDSDFAEPIFVNLPYELGPGASVSTVDIGIEVTKTLVLSVTNIATWTAEIAAPINEVRVDAFDALQPAAIIAQATARLSPDDLDQDGDGIPDNVEGTGDIDGNGIPNYLDPTSPTNESPAQQPGERGNIYMPALRNNN